MLATEPQGRLPIFRVKVVDPEILLVPGIRQIAEQLAGLGTDIGEPPGFGVGYPRDGMRRFEQEAKASLTLAQGPLSPLLLGDVDTGADVAFTGALGVKPGHARVEDPAIFPVEPSQPVFHSEFLPRLKGPTVRVQTALQIVRMDALAPAIPELTLQEPAGEVQPILVEVGTELIGARHPDHDGSRVGHPSKASFALAESNVRPLAGQGVGKDLSYQLQTLNEV